MAFPLADRVLENTTISGNVTIALAGPQVGYQAFGSGVTANGDIVPYVLTDGSGLLWETGYGVFSGACISRQTIQYSASGNAKIVFPNNSTKSVAMAPLANDFKNIVGSIGSGIFTIQSGSIGSSNLASGSIRSGHIASGQVGTNHIASGQINTFHFTSGAVLSGNIASGQIGQFHFASGNVNSGHIANNAVVSGSIASGQISTFHIASGGVVSGNIASGQIGRFHIAGSAVRSSAIASGQINPYHLSSGFTVQTVGPFVNGSPFSCPTEETVSGLRAVQISQSGRLRIAMAAISGRMPAIGICADNVASGQPANVYTSCVFQATSGLVDYSGYLGRTLYVGQIGHIVTTSGSYNSGGLSSGDIWHPIGYAMNSGGGVISMAAQYMFTMVSG